MKEAGYLYVNIDDTWEGERDSQGNIQTNRAKKMRFRKSFRSRESSRLESGLVSCWTS